VAHTEHSNGRSRANCGTNRQQYQSQPAIFYPEYRNGVRRCEGELDQNVCDERHSVAERRKSATRRCA
jgi:hypothetical protein